MTNTLTQTTLHSINPCDGSVVWTGAVSELAEIDAIIAAARAAQVGWRRTPVAERERLLRDYAEVLTRRTGDLTGAIMAEVGKPRWEALTEVKAMIGKVKLSIEALHVRTGEVERGGAFTRFRPHGVLAVFGPFNFPGHLPNGHIVPALLAGNAVVFKPSEQTPWTGELLVSALREAGLPDGLVGLVQGGPEVGMRLAESADIAGILFTGSVRTGLALHRALAGRPDKVLALELGGNNPLVVDAAGDPAGVAALVVQSAFQTAGQRCTCARRLIVPEGAAGDAVIAEVVRQTLDVVVGEPGDEPAPFMGPVISEAAARGVLAAASALVAAGARELVPVTTLRVGTGLLSPGIYDVTTVKDRPDEEIFGPLLQVIRVADFEAALVEANNTRYGLAAGLISDDRARYERFFDEVRAGVINWNRPLTGASGAAPFGGVGLSGNFRPGGFFAADYCAYPVASMETARLEVSS